MNATRERANSRVRGQGALARVERRAKEDGFSEKVVVEVRGIAAQTLNQWKVKLPPRPNAK
jgi:hypothetical protein